MGSSTTYTTPIPFSSSVVGPIEQGYKSDESRLTPKLQSDICTRHLAFDYTDDFR